MKSARAVAEDYAQKIWNDKDLSAIDALLHPEIIIHSLLGNFQGREAMKRVVEAWLQGFPDLHVKNKDVICEKDKVVLIWSAEGTHQGEFKGKKPSGRKVSYAGVTIYRMQEGKIKEYWAFLDMQYLLNQIS